MQLEDRERERDYMLFCIHDIWSGAFGLAVDSEGTVRFKSFTESTGTLSKGSDIRIIFFYSQGNLEPPLNTIKTRSFPSINRLSSTLFRQYLYETKYEL